VGNCLSALLAVERLGISLKEAADALPSLQAVAGRLKRVKTASLTIVDDAYNANPGSVAAGLVALGQIAGKARRVAVLGDMLELGPQSAELHGAAGKAAAAAGLQAIYAVGPESRALAETAARSSSGAEVRHFATVAAFLHALPGLPRRGDVWLVKASRGMALERVVEALAEWEP
jgi:UDP-N-acetylmuramoyl-tripeptide--D-alanyl-D-alanine ligase